MNVTIGLKMEENGLPPLPHRLRRSGNGETVPSTGGGLNYFASCCLFYCVAHVHHAHVIEIMRKYVYTDINLIFYNTVSIPLKF